MKKTFSKRFLTLALAVIMAVTMLASVTAFATTIKYAQLAAGKWAGVSYKSGVETIYKIKVDKPGMLNFTFATVDSNDYPSIYIYDNTSDITNLSGHKGSYKSLSYRTDVKALAVEPGTYYVDCNDGKFKYTFKAAASETNYCVAKAYSLAADTKKICMYTPKKNYSRWFKISNPSKKKISIWSNSATNAGYVEIYNAKMQKLELVQQSTATKYTTKAAQPAGTYLIRVKSTPKYYSDYDYKFGNVATLKWK